MVLQIIFFNEIKMKKIKSNFLKYGAADKYGAI